MIDFACMANEGYLRWTQLCVRAIERRQPGATIHLFDLSESRDSALRAAFGTHPGVRLTHFPPAAWQWPAWIDAAGFDFIWPDFGVRESLKYYSRKLRRALGRDNENWMTDKAAHVKRVRHFLRLVAQKPPLIECALSATRHNLVFLDVDALVLKPLDAVFEREFDFAVTTEDPQDIVIGPEPPQCTDRPHYPYKAINVGVMFARNTPRVAPLLHAWMREMQTVRHLSIEQTALAQLIHRLDPGFFEGHFRPRTLALEGGERVSVMALPMARYNFTRIRATDSSLAGDKLVAHFAGGRKQEQHWAWVQRLIFDDPR
jgi:hypothetical protein